MELEPVGKKYRPEREDSSKGRKILTVSVNSQLQGASPTLGTRAHPPHSELTDYTFSRYILYHLAPSELKEAIHPLYHRLNYVADVIKRGTSEGRWLGYPYSCILDTEDELRNESRRNTSSPSDHALRWCLLVESFTIEQANCDLWHIFRQSLLTASSVKWTDDGKLDTVGIMSDNSTAYVESCSVAFGKHNEPLAKSLVTMFCLNHSRHVHNTSPRRENVFVFEDVNDRTIQSESDYSCGLMIDTRTGMVGASLDMLVCERDPFGLLQPDSENQAIETYEIKCRAKYAFCPDKRSELSQCYERLLNVRTMGSLRLFISAIQHPCVDYFKPGNVPRSKEALITSNEEWKVGNSAYHAAQSRIRCNAFDKCHLELNSNVQSRVWLFGEPDLETDTIYPLPWDTGKLSLDVPIFSNPRHPNFKQIYLQTYVAAGYFGERRTTPFLVTFIGRWRKRREFGKKFSLIADSGLGKPISTVHADQAIPVLLIVTPVIVDEAFYGEIESAGCRAFGELVKQLWAKQPHT
ncbi:UL12 DNase [Meleagrid alphaherpesvirus 1]|uniref:UL12 DNase n=1 Tax=Meleagrid herpesvirus 1 TaxID=37108 RepID=Q9DPS2_MEHV1|nr:deoxyribonuclease [Meleagrid alphaherpesvirus 1]AKQ48604.1 deoxyribonuclease [iBAC vector pMeHV1-C7]AKQ48676.1 deoxyribonuclease [iBAC vector pMeHV1-C9]AKQ48748.1 deoxyribonuclease [iBAC vector pMeHV1-C10]AKQ48820.1 deoxyribonuclease [iBAC vector pMeHV1-C17]AKQ48892.1 deoxyribonuclease [iBAC vector pMeHV1-C18]